MLQSHGQSVFLAPSLANQINYAQFLLQENQQHHPFAQNQQQSDITVLPIHLYVHHS